MLKTAQFVLASSPNLLSKTIPATGVSNGMAGGADLILTKIWY